MKATKNVVENKRVEFVLDKNKKRNFVQVSTTTKCHRYGREVSWLQP